MIDYVNKENMESVRGIENPGMMGEMGKIIGFYRLYRQTAEEEWEEKAEVLLDEVMAGLTPPEVREIVKVIQEINAGGVTILLIEHIMEAIMSLSHHIIVISFGKKIAEGTPEEVANNKLVQEAYFGVEDDEILAGEVETHA